MFVSTKATSLMQLTTTQRNAPERQRRRKERHRSLASRLVTRVFSNQLPQLICEERAHALPLASGDRARFLQEARLDRNSNVMLGCHVHVIYVIVVAPSRSRAFSGELPL